MPVSQQSIDRLAQSVQPLVFETGIEEAPYSSTRGTAFLVGYAGRSYVVTARHALQPNNLVPVCVFPSDTSNQLIPLEKVFYVPQALDGDDISDLVVIGIDTRQIIHPDVAGARLIDLALSCGEWKKYAYELQFFTLGYPEERSCLKYEPMEFRSDRMVFLGRYVGPSTLESLHVLSVLDTLSLTTFSGLSGAPVFAWLELPKQRPVAVFWAWCSEGHPNQAWSISLIEMYFLGH